jgi:PRTRC genetic system protein E
MTMFQELYALATSATLTMIVSADEKSGKLTISVLPKPKKEVGEVALTKDLTLTATPEEFDAEFVQALQGYREVRASLMQQAEATREVLEAAKSMAAKKATDTMTKACKPATAAKPAPSVAADETDDEESTPTKKSGMLPASGESLSLFG